MIKPFGAVKGFGVGNNSAVSLDSAFEVVKKLNEVIEHINEAERDKEENTKEAYWIFDDEEYIHCSKCKGLFTRGLEKYYNYCPKCGALIVGVIDG